MTGADVQWNDLFIPVGKLDESVDKRLLPPGQLVSVVNCEFTSKEGSARKRPGAVLVSTPPVDPADGDPLPLKRLIPFPLKNQLLGVDLDGSPEAVPAFYSISDAPEDGDQAQTPRRISGSTNALVRQYPLASDLQSDIIADGAFVKTAGSFGYMVYGMVSKQTSNITVKIVQVKKTTQAWEPHGTVYESDIPYPREDGDAYWVRAAPSLDSYVLLTFGFDSGGIQGIIVDCTFAVPVVGSLTSIETDGNPGQQIYHDLCENTQASVTPSWLLVYDRISGPNLAVRVARIDDTLTEDWASSVLITADRPTAMSIFENAGRTWVNWFMSDESAVTPAPAWRYAQLDTADGSIDLSAQSWCVDATISTNASIAGRGRVSAICPTTLTDRVVLLHSQNYQANAGAHNPNFPMLTAMTRWRVGTSNGGLGGWREKRNIRLRSKPWRDNTDDWFCAWCDIQSVESYYAAPTYTGDDLSEPKFVFAAGLFRFSEDGATEADRIAAQLIATVGMGPTMSNLSELVSDSVLDPVEEDNYYTPASVTHAHATEAEETDALYLGRRCALNFRSIPLEQKHHPWDIATRFGESDDFSQGYGRYEYKHFGGAVYMAGGMLTEYDGDRHHENNYVKGPDIYVYNNHLVGEDPVDWPASYADWGDTDLYIQAVYETILENGERTRSATSAVRRIHLNDLGASGQPNNDVRLYIEPLTASMRAYGGSTAQEYQHPRTLVTIYGSAAPNSTLLQRWFSFTSTQWDNFVSDVDALEPIVYALAVAGTVAPPYDGWNATKGFVLPMATHEPIYNDSGELDNDLVFGGCSTLEVHKDRLWAAGGADAEVIWYSKERVDGRPAEFALGQQIRLPGQRVTKLVSHGGSLIVLCEHAVFAIAGEGPNALGDPTSGYFQIIPISTTTGCNVGASVASVPQGVIFRGEADLNMLSGGVITPLRHVTDQVSLAYCPVSSVIVPDSTQARIVLKAGETENNVLVYDWTEDKWATWRHVFAEGNVIAEAVLNRSTYILTSDGSVHREDPNIWADSDQPYRQSLAWGAIHFDRPLGYKIIHRQAFLLEPNPWFDVSATPTTFPCGVRVTNDYNYANGSSMQSVREWWSYKLGAITGQNGITQLGIHISKKKPSIQCTLEEVGPAVYLTSGNASATVDTTAGNNVLRLRFSFAGSFVALTVASNAAMTMVSLAADLNAQILAAGLDDYVEVVAGATDITIRTKKARNSAEGPYLGIDSVASGSTLNTPLVFSAAGETGDPYVPAAEQAGFVIQGVTYEVGQTRGPVRLPSAQSG